MKKTFTASIFIFIFCAFAFGQNSNCPTISITGPSSTVQPGETMTFAVNVSNVELNGVEYEWSVDKGTILEGLGTSVITISTEGINEATITASVKIKNLSQGCRDSISETGVVAGCGLPITFDDYEKLSINDEKARLDALAAELTAREEFFAYIIIYHPSKKGKRSYENRAARIRNYLVKERRIPSDQISIISGGYETEERTRIYIIPKGLTPPTP